MGIINKLVYEYMLEHKIFRLRELSRYLVVRGYTPWLAQYWVGVLLKKGIVQRIGRGYYKVNIIALKQEYPYLEDVEEVIEVG